MWWNLLNPYGIAKQVWGLYLYGVGGLCLGWLAWRGLGDRCRQIVSDKVRDTISPLGLPSRLSRCQPAVSEAGFMGQILPNPLLHFLTEENNRAELADKMGTLMYAPDSPPPAAMLRRWIKIKLTPHLIHYLGCWASIQPILLRIQRRLVKISQEWGPEC